MSEAVDCRRQGAHQGDVNVREGNMCLATACGPLANQATRVPKADVLIHARPQKSQSEQATGATDTMMRKVVKSIKGRAAELQR